MNPKQENSPLENTDQQTRFYLIFNEIAKASASISDVSLEEIDEIEQVGQLVMEVTEEQPTFMTST